MFGWFGPIIDSRHAPRRFDPRWGTIKPIGKETLAKNGDLVGCLYSISLHPLFTRSLGDTFVVFQHATCPHDGHKNVGNIPPGS